MMQLWRVVLLVALVWNGRADAWQLPPDGSPRRPFDETLSNLTPLAIGMTADESSRALGEPLQHVSGRPGDEIFLALRNVGGSGLVRHQHRLYLQFRAGRLTGWKEDYGRNWMWR